MSDNQNKNDMEQFDYNSIAINMVQFQVEYHLSDDNLNLDNFLLSKMHQNNEYWVSIKTIAELSKIKEITEDLEVILSAIRKSEVLILNEDESMVKRKNYIPPKPKQHKNMRRTVFIYGLSQNDDKQKIIELCSKFGKLRAIVFDNGSKYILDDVNIKAEDLEEIDRNVAIQIMTKKFGPRAVKSNSIAYGDVLTPSQSKAWLDTEQRRISTESNTESMELLSLQKASDPPTTPVFVHPIPNPNGDPLDFSHLKTCFVIFQSQSQANNFIKSRAKLNDGIRALHQYEYIKFQKRSSMNTARGISPLISPSSIGLTLNSPAYSILGSMQNNKKQSNNNHNNNNNMNNNNIQQQPTNAMEYYLANFNLGTPVMIVPVPYSHPPNSCPHYYPHQHQPQYHHHQRKETRNYCHPKTWSHGQQRNSNDYHHNGRFDFDINNHNKRRSSRKYYGDSQTVKHRNMRKSWRNKANNYQNSGNYPPSPSPNYFRSRRKENGLIKVQSNAPKYVVKHQSPAITPSVSTISVPNNSAINQKRATL